MQGQAFAGLVDAALQDGIRHAPQPAHEGEEFADPHMAVEWRVLLHVADAPAGFLAILDDVDPADADGSRAWPEIAGDDAKDRCLARSVGTEQADHFAVMHREGDIRDGRVAAVAFPQPLDGDDRQAGWHRIAVSLPPAGCAAILAQS